jgi:16S rRNA (guanine(966)-N(2))-methyltransferase RsmD
MRVIAGKYRRRTLQALPGFDLRPTADRLRETLFNVLASGDPEALEGTVWLDLFAGTGALGVEALSRGAAMVYFVEGSAKAAGLIRENLHSVGVESGFHVLHQDVLGGLNHLAKLRVAVDFAFLDPPYGLHAAYEQTLDAISRRGMVKPEGVIIAEHDKRFDPGDKPGSLARYRKLVQGDAALSFYRRASLSD